MKIIRAAAAFWAVLAIACAVSGYVVEMFGSLLLVVALVALDFMAVIADDVRAIRDEVQGANQ